MKSAFLLFAGILSAAVPDKLAPPAGEKQIVQVHGVGDQIYSCKNSSWTLKAPNAKLFSAEKKLMGSHFAGPTWRWKDQSAVIGKMVVTDPSPEADSIPWLLVKVVHHEGKGFLSTVTSVQRINTKGGKALSTGCDAAHAGAEQRVHYEADYVFYAKDK